MSYKNLKNVGIDFKYYAGDAKFIKQGSTEEFCKILDYAILSPAVFNTFFNGLIENNKEGVSTILGHANVLFDNDQAEIIRLFRTLYKILNIPLFQTISDYIGALFQENRGQTKEDTSKIESSFIEQINDLQQENSRLQNEIQELKKQLEDIHNSGKLDKKINQDLANEIEESKEEYDPNNVNIKTLKGYSKDKANFFKIYELLEKAAKEGDNGCFKYAVQRKYNEVHETSELDDIMTHAARKNNFLIAKMLVENGGDYLHLTYAKHNAFYYFCSNGNMEAVKYFAELKGIDVNSIGVSNETTLMIVSRNDCYHVCKFLLDLPEVQRTINMKHTSYGLTALGFAKSERIATLLKQHGAK